MPEFIYHGVSKDGSKVSGKLTAPNEGELRMMLRGQGIRPDKISKVGLLTADIGTLLRGGVIRIKIKDLVAFTRQLHVLINSGVPLVQSLEVLSDQTSESGFKGVIIGIREKVSQGTFFWEALAAHPAIFPKIYVSLIRAGESSGSLENVLKRLSRYLEDVERLRKMVRGALFYPGMVTLIGLAVMWLMLTFVVPRFETMMTGSGQELPALTAVVLSVSHFLTNHFIEGVIVLVVGAFLVIRYIQSAEGKAFLDRVLFKAPLFGVLMQKGAVARFSRTLSTLLSSGVNLVDAIDICKATVDHAVIEDAVGKIRSEIESGKSLGATVKRLGVFPEMSVQMMTVGESTGNLDKMLEKIADFYEQEVEAMVAGLTKLIEPLVLVVLGGAVGVIMIAMYLPIFKLAGGS